MVELSTATGTGVAKMRLAAAAALSERRCNGSYHRVGVGRNVYRRRLTKLTTSPPGGGKESARERVLAGRFVGERSAKLLVRINPEQCQCEV